MLARVKITKAISSRQSSQKNKARIELTKKIHCKKEKLRII